MKNADDRHYLLGLNLFGTGINRLLKTLHPVVVGTKSQNTPTVTVFTPNPEQFVQAKHSQSFAKTLGLADFLLPDGIGLIWASRVLATFGKSSPIHSRIAGVDVVLKLLEMAKNHHLSILIVGGRDYQPALEKFINQTGNFEQLFWAEGYADVTDPQETEERLLEELIAKIKPDLVFVAFGAPHQEKWIIGHLDLLNKHGVRLAMAVGGAIDMILHVTPRAPGLIRRVGLEWLYRLLRQPWRWRRQLRLLEFIKITIQEIF